ncbi:Glycosyl transferases group 1 [Porphyrobacter sp. LM 6]|nr:Glycosyl transferases group 1 [Porphyrobacter sp. LM 6]
MSFTIYGPHEDEDYWALCSAAIARLPANISVSIRGELPQERVAEVLRSFDLFFLPTLGENFGHSIAEALGAGLRVLISDRTMWRNLEREGVGHDLPLDAPEAFIQAIEDEAKLSWRAGQAARSRDYLSRKLNLAQLRTDTMALFSA